MTDAAQRPTTALAALDAYSDRLSRATDLEHVVDAALAGIGDLFPTSNALLLEPFRPGIPRAESRSLVRAYSVPRTAENRVHQCMTANVG